MIAAVPIRNYALSLILFTTAGAVLPGIVRGETYQRIGYNMQLKSVKNLFPKGVFEPVSPAWAQESDAMYSLTGPGISGSIVIMFSDSRPMYRRISSGDVRDFLDSMIVTGGKADSLANISDEDALRVQWVRWVPQAEIPLARLVAKYGPAESSGFMDDDFSPYRSWTTRGIIAYLDDKMAKVTRIDFQFTEEEKAAYYGYAKPKVKGRKPTTRPDASNPDTTGRSARGKPKP